MIGTFLSGLGLGLALIVAVGAQNLFLLRQGVKRQHMLALTIICIASDVILIAVSVAGVGLVVQEAPWALDIVRWAGAAFLAVYGLTAAWRAWRPSGEVLDTANPDDAGEATAGAIDTHAVSDTSTVTSGGTGPTTITAPHPVTAPPARPATRRSGTLLAAVLTCLALTWLNPHLYLDILMLGSISTTYGDARWWFAAGAMLGSTIWFVALALATSALGHYLRTRTAWRILDAIIAVIMLALAASLAFGH